MVAASVSEWRRDILEVVSLLSHSLTVARSDDGTPEGSREAAKNKPAEAHPRKAHSLALVPTDLKRISDSWLPGFRLQTD